MGVSTTSMTKRLSTGHEVTVTIPGEGVTDEQQPTVYREIVAALREYAAALERAGKQAEEKIKRRRRAN